MADKRTHEEPITLSPLSFEEALRGLLDTPPMPDDDKQRRKRRDPSEQEQQKPRK
jgi:hypothetical protein